MPMPPRGIIPDHAIIEFMQRLIRDAEAAGAAGTAESLRRSLEYMLNANAGHLHRALGQPSYQDGTLLGRDLLYLIRTAIGAETSVGARLASNLVTLVRASLFGIVVIILMFLNDGFIEEANDMAEEMAQKERNRNRRDYIPPNMA